VQQHVNQLWIEGLIQKPNFRINHTFKGFSIAAIQYIKNENPDFVYQVGAGIIPRHFIERVPPILNLHPAILPGVRGYDPVFWTHYYGIEDCLGSTLHLIDEGIDTGQPLLRMRFDVSKGMHYGESIKKQIVMERELLKLFFNNYPAKYAQYDMGGSNISIYRSFWSRQQYEQLRKANWWKAQDI
jgi:methionyl-tRNA formyltransferase